MNIKFHIIIPARYESKRLPGKLLLDIAGKTVLERAYLQALQASPSSLIIATDNQIIMEHAQNFGAHVQLTASKHRSGTDRIAEVVTSGKYAADDIIINVQGDEPFINPRLITQLAAIMADSDIYMATLCAPFIATQQNLNTVKVVRDCFNNALYFSRSSIPHIFHNNKSTMLKHIGIYAYKAKFLQTITNIPQCELEISEDLEQLRVLWLGYKIRVEEACVEPLPDINTLNDVEFAKKFAIEFLEV